MLHTGLSLPARFLLLALAASTTACTTISTPDLLLDIPKLAERPKTQLDPRAEYEKAKLECADEGGEWVVYLHGDGAAHYLDSMRCRSSRSLANDLRWKDPGLLPYDVTVVYDTGTEELIRFARIDPESKEELVDDHDRSDEKE